MQTRFQSQKPWELCHVTCDVSLFRLCPPFIFQLCTPMEHSLCRCYIDEAQVQLWGIHSIQWTSAEQCLNRCSRAVLFDSICDLQDGCKFLVVKMPLQRFHLAHPDRAHMLSLSLMHWAGPPMTGLFVEKICFPVVSPSIHWYAWARLARYMSCSFFAFLLMFYLLYLGRRLTMHAECIFSLI